LIASVANALGVSIQLEKVESLPEIMRYGVMSTPGVVIDGKVVHAGGVPTRAQVESWLKPAS
jgi:predicted thioredoxin/glutaredoxin